MIQSQYPMLKKFAPIIVILAAAALGIFLSMGSFTSKSVAQATTAPAADDTAATPTTQAQPQETDTMPKQQWSEAPKMTIDVNKTYTAHMETTLGPIDLVFFPKEAPQTVNSFIFLAKQG